LICPPQGEKRPRRDSFLTVRQMAFGDRSRPSCAIRIDVCAGASQ
jgi:hypothetical protein